jgi:hypothetical protein
MTLEDLMILFKYIIPDEQTNSTASSASADIDEPADEEGGASAPKGKTKVTEQGMVVEDKKNKKHKRKGMITRDSARDQRYARFLRGMSNDIAHYDDASGGYIHPLTIAAIGSMLYSRYAFLFLFLFLFFIFIFLLFIFIYLFLFFLFFMLLSIYIYFTGQYF